MKLVKRGSINKDEVSQGRFHEKKVAVLLDFVHFSKTVYIGPIWGWGEGETPAQVVWNIGVQ